MAAGNDAFFRAGAGAVIINDAGEVLAMRRKGATDGAWQMPQGGVGFAETPEQAAWREAEEETGLRRGDLELVAQADAWTVYELPPAYRSEKVGWGQVQRWFLFRAKAGATVKPDGREFDAFSWLTAAELLSRAVAFRVPVYEHVFAQFAQWLTR